jgi:exopolysaccharide biosynthesis protein
MNLQELAEYLLSLGAVDAMNLDGGGSTTMFVDGKVCEPAIGQRRRTKSQRCDRRNAAQKIISENRK